MAAASMLWTRTAPSRHGAPPPPIVSRKRARNCAAAPARARASPRSISASANMAIQPLAQETSIGYDVGVDRSLLAGRMVASLSLFEESLRDIVEFGRTSSCSATQAFGCYSNVDRARTKGIDSRTRPSSFPSDGVCGPARASRGWRSGDDRSLFRRPHDKGTAPSSMRTFQGSTRATPHRGRTKSRL